MTLKNVMGKILRKSKKEKTEETTEVSSEVSLGGFVARGPFRAPHSAIQVNGSLPVSGHIVQ